MPGGFFQLIATVQTLLPIFRPSSSRKKSVPFAILEGNQDIVNYREWPLTIGSMGLVKNVMTMYGQPVKVYQKGGFKPCLH
jgi:hypothetical protein